MASAATVDSPDGQMADFHHLARQLLRLRRERQRHFPIDATGPAWDLMLGLFEKDGENHRPALGDLATWAHVPRTTAIRWLRQLEHHGFVALVPDRRDKRLVRVALSDSGRETMIALFTAAELEF
jgi:DNA-binding MarR family transcriptional regulator